MGAYYFCSLVKWQTERVGTWEHLQFPSSSIIFNTSSRKISTWSKWISLSRWFKSFQLCRNQSDLYFEKKNIKKKRSPVVQRTETLLYLVNMTCEYCPLLWSLFRLPPQKKSTNKPTKQRTSTTSVRFSVVFRIFWASSMGHVEQKISPKKSRLPSSFLRKTAKADPALRCSFVSPLSSGLIFAFGLGASGMTNPMKAVRGMTCHDSIRQGGGWNLNLGEESHHFFGGGLEKEQFEGKWSMGWLFLIVFFCPKKIVNDLGVW